MPRGRPRDPALDRRIIAAVLDLLAEKGLEGVSFEAVARRCGASKATLYRRWSTKRDMVLAAVKDGPSRHTAAALPRGETLREDLLALVRRLRRTMAAAEAGTALMLLQAGLEDPELCDAIEAAMGPTGARLPRSVLEDAISRGELPPGADPFAYEEVVGAVLLTRRANGLALDEAHLAALVDSIVLPALVASAGRPDLPAGIFSGHPLTETPTTEETP